MTENSADVVHPEFGCPRCGATVVDLLEWLDDETVRCSRCDTKYRPGCPPPAEPGNGTAAP